MLYKENTERNDNQMPFVGLFKSKEGIVAFGDSKSSCKDSYGNLYEEQNRVTQKVFATENFLFVTFGSNLYVYNNEHRYLEILLKTKTINYNGFAKEFFEEVYRDLSETFMVWPTESYNFIYGEKVNSKFYLYSIIINKDGIAYEKILRTVNQIYNKTPMCPQSLSIDSTLSIQDLNNNAITLVSSIIQLGDTFLKYNPVGGNIHTISMDIDGHIKTYINGIEMEL